jgi:tRNA-dihydrouridine synthase B
MIGRAAMGRPWLVGEIAAGLADEAAYAAPDNGARHAAALEHYDTLLALFGARAGLRHARKHLSAYAEHAWGSLIKSSPAAAADRLRLVTSEEATEVRRLLASLFANREERVAA